MASSSSHQLGSDDIPIEELIFSCSICQATVSDVYTHTESNKGFHSGSGDEDGIVTKLWIAECSHVTCSTHLEGGAAPLHPKDDAPRAACPRCIQANDDDTPKALYGIRGLGKGQYDPAIPSEWRRCPAIKLDSSIPGMEAVRFQYMALVHYAGRIRQQTQDALRKVRAVETAFAKERKQRRQLQSEVLDLQGRLERAEEAQSKLDAWEKRKPKIFHYLGVFGEMMSEIQGHRALLRNLGYQVSEKSYAYPGDEVAQAENTIAQQHTVNVGRPSMTSTTTAHARETEGSSSARKRKFEAAMHDEHNHAHKARGSSRDLMPPPLPKPKQPLHSHHAQAAPRAQHSAQPLTYHPGSARSQSERQMQHEQLPFRPPPPPDQAPRFIQRPSRQWQDDEGRNSSHAHGLEPTQDQHNYHYAEPVAHPQYQTTMPAHSHLTGHRTSFQGFGEAGDDPRVSSYDDAYGTLADQGATQDRSGLPLREPSVYGQGQAQAIVENRTPEYQAQHVQPATTRSPFFKAGSAYARPDGVYPQTRGVYSRAKDVSGRPTLHTSGARAPLESPFAIRQRQSTGEQPAYHSSQRYAERQQQAFALPQTPRNSQGFFERTDRPPPSALSYAPSRPQTNNFRSRVSLPPNSGRMGASLYGNQDGALSRIQGVRGLTSQQGQPSAYGPPPAFGAPRQLFSAAGSRRSVRR